MLMNSYFETCNDNSIIKFGFLFGFWRGCGSFLYCKRYGSLSWCVCVLVII
ncbi:hypothetical protein HanRHA438_Chr04g0156111 [Helianthus annuus]|nr:hypothetical protein HanIR_Chr04g0157141 [Helianthus annuus]KAJ0925128.1 hypothetical protein HanRHA438_Chr04g0156111 [Helianthus annuus]